MVIYDIVMIYSKHWDQQNREYTIYSGLLLLLYGSNLFLWDTKWQQQADEVFVAFVEGSPFYCLSKTIIFELYVVRTFW